LLLPVSVSASFFYAKIKTFGQEHGKGSMGMQAWNMGTGEWRWDSEAIFSGCLLSKKNFTEMEQ
jgi:hypothetical protein